MLAAAALIGGCAFFAFHRIKKKSKTGAKKIFPRKAEEANTKYQSDSEDDSDWDTETETESELDLEDDLSISSVNMHSATPLPENSSFPGSVPAV